MAKDKLILTDGTKFNDILKQIAEDRKPIANDLIKEICFMGETLTELKKMIKETGAVELFEQGKQKFMRENPALKSYNATIKQYSSIYKQLTDLIPKTITNKEDDGFDDFVSDRDD